MRNYNIKNLDELQATRRALKAEYMMQEVVVLSDVKLYLRQYTFKNMVRKYLTPSTIFKADEQLHISGKVMSFILPVLMNNTLFRGSGFITKALVGLATSNVGKTLDAEHLSGIFNSVKSWIGGKKKLKAKPVGYVDYGIPPDSETY
jgi:hypothetical protein